MISNSYIGFRLTVKVNDLPDIFHGIGCHLQERSSGTAEREKLRRIGSVYFWKRILPGKSVDQFGVKGYRDILTVLILIHVSGMKGIGIAERLPVPLSGERYSD